MRTFICSILLLAATARAQTLADHVPADAAVYFGWKGSATAENGYGGSHLEAVVNAFNTPALREQLLPQLIQKIKENDKHFDDLQQTETLAGIIFRHPAAFFFEGLSKDAAGQPIPKLGLLCQAGDESATLLARLKELTADAKPGEKIRVAAAGDLTMLLTGFDDNETLPGAGQSLTSNSDFLHLIGDSAKSDMISLYVDAGAIFKMVDDGVAAGTDEDAKTIWPHVRDASGLTAIRHIAYSAGFSGKDWQSGYTVDAPAPRAGLLTVVEPQAIDPALMERIAATSPAMSLGTFDFGALLAQIRVIASAASPQGGDYFDKAMGAAQMMIGRSLQHDVLEPLGSQWACYTDASTPMPTNSSSQPLGPGLNFVLVNKLRDPARAKQGWSMLYYAMANIGTAYARRANMPITAVLGKNGDQDVYTIQTPMAQPSWTMKDGFIYFGLSPAAVIAAANRSPAPADRPALADLARQIAPNVMPNGFKYSDLPSTASDAYSGLQAGLKVSQRMAQQQGVTVPDDLLPPLEVLKRELSPSLAINWADAAGWHGRSHEPFPGSAVFSTQPGGMMTVGGAALGTSILLPALDRARETANRIKCASNERQIGIACLLYANDNKGAYPDDFTTLMKTEKILPDVFLCPSSDTAIPADKATGDDLIAWVNEHSDYVYCGKGLTNATAGAQTIVLYEKPDDHRKDGMNILFGDGHVELVLMKQAVQMIRGQQKDIPAVPLPEVP